MVHKTIKYIYKIYSETNFTSISIPHGIFANVIKHLSLCVVFVISFLPFFGQEKSTLHFYKASDTLHKKRLITVSVAQAAIWTGSLIALNNAWYANYPRSSFQFFNDIKEWKQVDKIGHAYSAYWGAQLSASLFRWSGVSRKKSALYGAGMGVAFESVIEILDGFSAGWGFSVGDMGANILGSATFAAQELAWEEQRVQFKFSTHKIHYPESMLQTRANELYGSSLAERILKDYNAQTYWLSANIWSFNKKSKWPKWLNIAVGYGADGIYGGFENVKRNSNHEIELNPNGQPSFDRRDIQRTRQFYVAPDIDLSKITIRGKRPALLKLLNGVRLKFPTPAFEWNTRGQFIFHPVYF